MHLYYARKTAYREMFSNHTKISPAWIKRRDFSPCNLGPLLNYLTTIWPSTFNWVIKSLCCHLVRLSVDEIGYLTLRLKEKKKTDLDHLILLPVTIDFHRKFTIRHSSDQQTLDFFKIIILPQCSWGQPNNRGRVQSWGNVSSPLVLESS